MFKLADNYPFIVLPILFLLAGCADRVANRKADLGAANKVKGGAGRFLKSAAMKAINNLNKLRSI